MKKLSIIFYTLVVVVLLVSCKKGEDDPFISFKSRKARVEGSWALQKGDLEVVATDSAGKVETMQYKINDNQYVYDETSSGEHGEGACSLNLSFTKKGAVTIEQKIDFYSMKGSGTWDFLGKIGEAKNKEGISIQLSNLNNISYFVDTFNKMQMNFTYRIKELRSKHMVLVCEKELVEVNSGFSFIVTAEYVFVQ